MPRDDMHASQAGRPDPALDHLFDNAGRSAPTTMERLPMEGRYFVEGQESTLDDARAHWRARGYAAVAYTTRQDGGTDVHGHDKQEARRIERGFAVPCLRTPPHNFEAEMALLAALLSNNKAYDRIGEILKPEHFADERHGRIYDACAKLIQRGQSASAITLKNYFEQDDSLAEIGGVGYLVKLAASAVTIINAGEYATIIRDMYQRRRLIEAGEEIVNAAYSHDLETTAESQIEAAEARLFEIAESAGQGSDLCHFADALDMALAAADAARKADGKVVGVTTGLVDLNRRLGGLHDTDLIILAGRPAMGKSALALKIAEAAAADEKPAAVFSLEMSRDQLAARQLAARTGVSVERQRSGQFSNEEANALVVARGELRKLPLWIDDKARSVEQIRHRARRLKRKHGIRLIVIDYLQLMVGGKAENRVQEVSRITRELKLLAKELGIPILALSQLSRAVEQREDKRPQLSDLRESGTIEQDADIVLMLYRHEYYLAQSVPQRREDESENSYSERLAKHGDLMTEHHGIAEILIRKNRHGAIATVRARFDAERTLFDNLATDDR